MGNPRRKIPELDGGIMCSGAKIPSGWATRLSEYAADRRRTRADVVREALAAWLKKRPQYTNAQQAAEHNNRSYGQQLRQILEDELPSVCIPFPEFRGNGAAWAKAIREGRAKSKLVPTFVITLPEHAGVLVRKVAKAKADVYPTPEAVIAHLVTRWADKLLEKTEGGGSNPPTTQHA